jgi:outer membrane lipoprotein SlyB
MDIPTTTQRQRLHPLLLSAALAVVLFCGVGSAALMGWLPNSQAREDAARVAAEAAAPQAATAQDRASKSKDEQGQPAPAPLAQRNACSDCGVITTIRSVEQRGQASGVGAAGGAILGGLLGNQVGSGHGRQLATVAGAVGGAVAGNQVEGKMHSTRHWEITVRMENGSHRVLQQANQPDWHEGDAVRIERGQLRAD